MVGKPNVTLHSGFFAGRAVPQTIHPQLAAKHPWVIGEGWQGSPTLPSVATAEAKRLRWWAVPENAIFPFS